MMSENPEIRQLRGPGDAEVPDAGPGLHASLEAILLVADEPVPVVVLAQVLERPRSEVEAELRDLAAYYAADSRGFDLREIAGGWRFYTREDCAPLSSASSETARRSG